MAPQRTASGRRSYSEAPQVWVLGPAAMLLAVLGGYVASKLVAMGQPGLLFLVVIIPAVPLVWRWPVVAVSGILAATASVEQFQYVVSANVKSAFTTGFPFFRSLSQGTGVSPAEMVLAVTTLIVVMKAVAAKSWNLLPRTPLSRAIAVFVGVVVLGFLLGQARHGEIRIALWEIRPFFYLGMAYMLSAALFQSRRALRSVLWVLVLGSGFKALQGVRIFWAVRSEQPRPEAVLGHEEAFFFGMFIMITFVLWIYGDKGKLRATATALLPLVFVANLGNSRRNAWAILAFTLFVMFAITYCRLSERRSMLRRLGALMIVFGAVYFPAYWNSGGTAGQPARAVRSEVSPSARDLQSNQYRQAENANLLLNIQESHSLGKGYGVPIDYAIAITDLSDINSAISFIPHNGVLYIWMRLGILGEIAFLCMVGSAVIQACQLVKVADKELSLLGTVAACAIVGYMVQGYNDLGFFWFRIALAVGVLLGAVEAGLRLSRDSQAPTNHRTIAEASR